MSSEYSPSPHFFKNNRINKIQEDFLFRMKPEDEVKFYRWLNEKMREKV